MKQLICVLIMLGVLVSPVCVHAWNQEEITEEELLLAEIPVVFSSSKRQQPITEAASSIEIVTADDIKQSGATNIGDVLRSFAGIDVRESDAGQHVIGVRGFCDTGHLLVTLDGNNVFMYHANHIFLDWIPVALEEIDHIEIIKGPGAIFYGGNAFSGIINIVTRKPDQLGDLNLNFAMGNWNAIRGNILHAGKYKDFDYSLSGGYRGADQWEEPNQDMKSPAGNPVEGEDFSVAYFGGKTVYNINDESSLSFMGRYSDARNVISTVCQPKTTFMAVRYDRSDFWVRLFHNHHKKTFWDGTFGVEDSNYELEILRIFRWGNNITSIGGFVKHTEWNVETLKYTGGGPEVGSFEEHAVKDGAINLENEMRLNEKFIVTLGARGEYYTHLDYMGLGRVSFIFKPTEDQSLRYTVASGYYIPSLFQHTNEGEAYPFAVGNYSLNEEKITSFELNYYGYFIDGVKIRTAVFYNIYKDLIDNTQSGPMLNVGGATQMGGEFAVDFDISDRLSGFANYAFQTVDRDDYGKLAVDPEHKFNCGLRAKWSDLTLNMTFHYVDTFFEQYLTSNPVFGRVGAGPVNVKTYNLLSTRIGYNLTSGIELYFAGYNLGNNRHYESNPPDSDSGNWHTGDLIGRRIMAGLSYNY